MIVEIEHVKEMLQECMAGLVGVINKIDETQATVVAVFNEPDEYFAAAKENIETGIAGLANVCDGVLTEAVGSIGQAGQ